MVEICYAKQIKADIEFCFLWNGSCSKDCGSIIIGEMYYERVNAGEKHKMVTSFGIKEIKKKSQVIQHQNQCRRACGKELQTYVTNQLVGKVAGVYYLDQNFFQVLVL
jgi:hypothetical protein